MAKNKKSKTQKERDAKAIAARRHPKNKTDNVIVIAPDQESKDLLDASKNPADALSEDNPGGVSDQAAADLTINTQSASDDPLPVVSYMDATDIDEPVIDPADDPQPTKTNEQMALESAAEAAIEDDPFEVKLAEFSLYLRDNTVKVFKTAHDAVVNGWIALGAKAENGVDKFYAWCHKQNHDLATKWAQWFPKPFTRADFMDEMAQLAEILSGSYKEQSETNIRVASQLVKLAKVVTGEEVARTVSADKLDDFIAAYSKGEKTKAATMYSALTGSTLAAAKQAVSGELTH